MSLASLVELRLHSTPREEHSNSACVIDEADHYTQNPPTKVMREMAILHQFGASLVVPPLTKKPRRLAELIYGSSAARSDRVCWPLYSFHVATHFLAATHLVGVIQSRPFPDAQLLPSGDVHYPRRQKRVDVGLLSQVCGVRTPAVHPSSCIGYPQKRGERFTAWDRNLR